MPKRNVALMLILSVVTCGLYSLYWIYAARTEFKQFSGYPDVNPALELLLCLICFPYTYFWIYKFSIDIARCQREHGKPGTDNSVINLLLTFFGLFIVSELIIQTQLNELAE